MILIWQVTEDENMPSLRSVLRGLRSYDQVCRWSLLSLFGLLGLLYPSSLYSSTYFLSLCAILYARFNNNIVNF
jgi:hypothetical protein